LVAKASSILGFNIFLQPADRSVKDLDEVVALAAQRKYRALVDKTFPAAQVIEALMLKPLFKTTDDIVPLILRVLLGTVFFPHGAQKVPGWFGGYGFGGTMGAFTQQMHILALFAEFAGSLALIAGLFTDK
jgi:hypothetical protein